METTKNIKKELNTLKINTINSINSIIHSISENEMFLKRDIIYKTIDEEGENEVISSIEINKVNVSYLNDDFYKVEMENLSLELLVEILFDLESQKTERLIQIKNEDDDDVMLILYKGFKTDDEIEYQLNKWNADQSWDLLQHMWNHANSVNSSVESFERITIDYTLNLKNPLV